MQTPTQSHDAVHAQLERVLASTTFRGAERSSSLLRFLVARALDGQSERLKEYTVGVEALGKDVAFDPRIDPIVRAEASRLRSRLERFYASEGAADVVRIELPKGTYLPRISTRSAEPSPTPPSPSPSPAMHAPRAHEGAQWWRRPSLTWALGVVSLSAAAFALGAAIAGRTKAPVGPALLQLDVLLQDTGHLASEVGTDVVISPDGTRVVFVSTDSTGVPHLRTRRLDGGPPVDLPGTQGARGPFFSPDGRWVGFWAAAQVRKVSLDGGLPTVLTDATDLLGAAWGDDGTIIANLNSSSALSRVPASGGTPTIVLDLASESARPLWPQWLPGGTHVLYTRVAGYGADAGVVEVLRLRDGTRTRLVSGGTFGRYLASGQLTWINQGTLYAAPFDASRPDAPGPGVPVLERVAYSTTFGFAQFDVSRTGVAVYRQSPSGGALRAVWIDSAGHITPALDAPARYVWPTLSPDGRWLAVSLTEQGQSRLALFDGMAQGTARLVRRHADILATAWSPDSRFLIASGKGDLTRIGVGGSTQTLVKDDVIRAPWSVSPDGRRVALSVLHPRSAFDLWTMATDSGGGAPTVLRRTPGFETYPAFAPDGRWLAYASDESGIAEVYVRSYPDSGTAVRVSTGGGRVSRWSSDGRRLFYATDDQRLMVVPIATQAGRVVAGTPVRWTTVRLGETGVLPNFDVAPGGQRVLALVPPESAATFDNHVTLITNLGDAVARQATRR